MARTLVLAEPPGYTAQEAFSRGDVETAVNAFLRGITGRHINIDELPRAIREPIRANGLALKAELDVSDPFTCLDARRISAPTLLVRGEQSPAFLGAIIDRLARCLPNTDQLVLRGASHFLHWEAPQEFNEAQDAFLARKKSANADARRPAISAFSS